MEFSRYRAAEQWRPSIIYWLTTECLSTSSISRSNSRAGEKNQRVLLSLIQLSVASLPCKLGLEYWDPKQDTCIKCSKCDEQMIVIRPCQPHQDVACGTINELDIDWSWFKKLENRKVCFMTVFHFLGNFQKILYSYEIERILEKSCIHVKFRKNLYAHEIERNFEKSCITVFSIQKSKL